MKPPNLKERVCRAGGFSLMILSCFGLLHSHAFSKETLPLIATENDHQIIIESDIQTNDSSSQVVTAVGNVRIIYPSRGIKATSSQLQYFGNEKIVILSGDVDFIRKGEASISADRLVYMLSEDKMVADSYSKSQVFSKFLLYTSFPDKRSITP